MAKIWAVHDGMAQETAGLGASIPLEEAINLFKLKPESCNSDLETLPHFGNSNHDLWYLGYKHVVVKITQKEAKKTKFNPGYYNANVSPDKALNILTERVVSQELGAGNVIRLDITSSTDSQGQGVFKIIVVIPPDATDKIGGPAALNAMVKVKKLFSEMRIHTPPLVEFSTEAEMEG